MPLNLRPETQAKLEAHAAELGMSVDDYLEALVKRDVRPTPERPLKPKKSAYGLLAHYGSGPSEAEIDENRREMCHGFAKDF
jgi:hypothetical protein